MSFGRFRLVVFDFDGTLVDSLAAIVSVTEQSFARHGLPRPAKQRIRQGVGIALEGALQRLLPADSDETLLQKVTATFRERAMALRAAKGVEHEPLFDGIRAVLDRLKDSPLLLAIATGKNRRGLLHSLEGHGLREHFTILKTADDGPSKPHPDILEQALREAGVEPAEALMIGDSTYDIEMAQAAGTAALGVAWGYHEITDLESAGATAIVRAPSELLACLQRLGES